MSFTRAEPAGRNKTDGSQRPRCNFFQRNLNPPLPAGRGINISGVDFWHAVEFSRNGRFLCTHPLGLSSGRFPSVFHFILSCGLAVLLSCVSDSIRLFRVRFPVGAGLAFQFFAFAFPFPAVPTLPDSLGPTVCLKNSGGLWIGLLPFG